MKGIDPIGWERIMEDTVTTDVALNECPDCYGQSNSRALHHRPLQISCETEADKGGFT